MRSTAVPQKRVAWCRRVSSHGPKSRLFGNASIYTNSTFYGSLQPREGSLVTIEVGTTHFVRNEGAVGSNPITSTMRTGPNGRVSAFQSPRSGGGCNATAR
jgi:hypothetical protein